MKLALIPVAGLLIGLSTVAMAAAAPCTTTKPVCTEWITFRGGPARSLMYRNHPLDQKDERITRAMIMVHGAGRDADNYFRTAVAAAFLADALEDTIVISPRFACNGGGCQDTLAPNEVNCPATATAGGRGANGVTEFRPFGDGRNCTTYDTWPYGIQHRTGYASRLTDDQLKTQLAARPTTYLVGELDTLRSLLPTSGPGLHATAHPGSN